MFVGNLWERPLRMARSIRNPKLDTRSARTKLPVRKAPYWAPISPGFAVGYRKGVKGGTWIAKFVGEVGRHEARIGPADDHLDADGMTSLSFSQAQEKARDWIREVNDNTNGEARSMASYTVADAVRDYLDWFAIHRKSLRETTYNFEAFVLPTLGQTPVARLSAAQIRKWHRSIAETPPRLRTRAGQPQKYRAITNDPEARRRRKSTANHVLTNLKAALNLAWQEGRIRSDDAWRRVKPFANVDAARVRYLSDDECKRLINATDPIFRPLVLAALYSGCRYGELIQLSVRDFNPDAGTLFIRDSKSGKPRQVVLATKGRDFFQNVTAGHPGNQLIFLRPDGEPWGKSHQIRRLSDACKRGHIHPKASFHILRHTYASHLIMNGAPLAVVAANLGHTDTRMVERHYAHLAPNYIAQEIRSAATNLESNLPREGNVVQRIR